jgi:CubicO group peptidase (beta-lactamase class C family)
VWTLPSGATVKVPPDWTLTAAADGIVLMDPENGLRIDLVEVAAASEMTETIATAWSLRHPRFDRGELAASDSPGRRGWDLFRWSRYKTSPEESRQVSAFAARKGPLAVVVLVDGSLAAVERRSSQVGIVQESLRPAGYARETYRGRTPRALDASRVAELKTFIGRMREAADVPGVSVVLFDTRATLIEEGFGVRERGRPEPVTADSLYVIASNTKPLTTLLLARLADEGRFGWETPVTRIDPRFRLGDPDVTRRILVKHLVCACTGLPRQDFEWLFTFNRSSPQGQLDVLATMKPTTEFGALYQYSNPLASAAGYIGARLVKPDVELGRAYDEMMREKVFRPLGMSRTTFSFPEALGTDHASPHSWDLSLRNVPIEMALNHSIIPIRPAGGAWSSARDYARYVRLELARGRLPDGSTFVTEKNLLARRVPQVRAGEDAWYGMGLWIQDVKDIRVISHGGSMFGYKSNFFFGCRHRRRDPHERGFRLEGLAGGHATDSGGGLRRRTGGGGGSAGGDTGDRGGPAGRAAGLDGASRALPGEAARGLLPERGARRDRRSPGSRRARVPFRGLEESHGDQAEPGWHHVVRLDRSRRPRLRVRRAPRPRGLSASDSPGRAAHL